MKNKKQKLLEKAMLDSDGYCLKLVENWDIEDTKGFLDFIEGIWTFVKFGFRLKMGENDLGRKCCRLCLSTGGWSGNESIIEAMRKNDFWWMYWESERRGGHYVFEIPLEKLEGGR